MNTAETPTPDRQQSASRFNSAEEAVLALVLLLTLEERIELVKKIKRGEAKTE